MRSEQWLFLFAAIGAVGTIIQCTPIIQQFWRGRATMKATLSGPVVISRVRLLFLILPACLGLVLSAFGFYSIRSRHDYHEVIGTYGTMPPNKLFVAVNHRPLLHL